MKRYVFKIGLMTILFAAAVILLPKTLLAAEAACKDCFENAVSYYIKGDMDNALLNLKTGLDAEPNDRRSLSLYNSIMAEKEKLKVISVGEPAAAVPQDTGETRVQAIIKAITAGNSADMSVLRKELDEFKKNQSILMEQRLKEKDAAVSELRHEQKTYVSLALILLGIIVILVLMVIIGFVAVVFNHRKTSARIAYLTQMQDEIRVLMLKNQTSPVKEEPFENETSKAKIPVEETAE